MKKTIKRAVFLLAVLLLLPLPVYAQECVHDWIAMDTVPASPEQDGYTLFRCALCRAEKTETVHRWKSDIIPPDCTEGGYTLLECLNCGLTKKTAPTPANGHDWGAWVKDGKGNHSRVCAVCLTEEQGACVFAGTVTVPDCTKGGYTTDVCTVCQFSRVHSYVPPQGHDWQTAGILTAALCGVPGEEIQRCSRCSETRTAVIPPTGLHTAVTDEGFPATCTENGLTDGKHCTVCGTVLVRQSVIFAEGHIWIDGDTVREPDCAPGELEQYCGSCGAVRTTAIAPIEEHSPVTDAAVAADCENDGLTEGSHCEKCGTVLTAQQIIPAFGHDWEDTVLIPVSCTQDGLRNRVCRRCAAKVEQETVPSPGHRYVVLPAVAVTCTRDGLTAGLMCEYCRTVTRPQQIIPATGHSYTTEEVPPDCTRDGSRTYTCRCGDSYTEVIPKTGHDYSITEETAATCTAAGIRKTSCSRCGDFYYTKITVLPHTLVTQVIGASCTEPGKIVRTCSVCGFSEITPEGSALGHDFVLYLSVSADCTHDGSDTYLCRRCGKEEIRNIVPALGHVWGKGTVVPPTCREPGYTRFRCMFCDEFRDEDPVPPGAHSLVSVKSNGDGTHTGECQTCGLVQTAACEGKRNCLELTVCTVCGGSFGTLREAHSFTHLITTDNTHSYACAYCDETGNAESHTFVRGRFLPTGHCYTYSCAVCSFVTFGRPIGDTDGDGVLTSADARLALRISVNLETPSTVQRKAADVNRDGAVTAEDARTLLRAAVGLESNTNWGVLRVEADGNQKND